MNTGTIIGMAATGILVLAAAFASGFVGWMMWALALNGFMGQERAVETSQAVYFVLAAISGLLMTLLSVLAVYLLSGRRGWNAVGSAALSIVIFSTSILALHVGCIVVSAIVADQMRTNR